MPLFHHEAPPPPPDPDDAGDTPAAMRAALAEVNRTVNRAAGRLPVEATVEARRVGDVLAAILTEADTRPLDMSATVAVRSTIEDYLPTTIRAYLAVDAAAVDVPRPGGATPRQSLLEQLDALADSSNRLRDAARQQDADALLTQGSFLRTKFARSDLEL